MISSRAFRTWCLLVLPLLAIACLHSPLGAQERLRVGLYESPPFVMDADGNPTGMAVEIWESLADTFELEFDYTVHDTLRALVDATAAGDADVAVTNLTISRARAERLDFTQPWFDGGMRIMVSEKATSGFGDLVAGLRDSGHLRAYAWLAGVILVGTAVLTFFDRRFDPDFPRHWPSAVAESFYNVMSVATSGRMPARKNLFGWLGRIWQALWLVCGVAVLAYVTSSVTSVMTTLSLTREINSVADLPGRTVGVLDGSVAHTLAQRRGYNHQTFAGVEAAAAALVAGDVDAVVADAPVLEYFAHTNTAEPLAVVGPIFEPDKYGFAMPRGSPLGKELTLGILTAHEREIIRQLRLKYFGPRE